LFFLIILLFSLTGCCANPILDKVEPYQDKHFYWIPVIAGMTGGLVLQWRRAIPRQAEEIT
jgi:hypothetical protein